MDVNAGWALVRAPKSEIVAADTAFGARSGMVGKLLYLLFGLAIIGLVAIISGLFH
jgi:hypothetical protein